MNIVLILEKEELDKAFMKTYEHYKNIGGYPSFDQINYIWDWSQFNDDPRTQNLDLHLGSLINHSLIRDDKINVHGHGEHPNGWWNGKKRGRHVPEFLEREKRFDYIFSHCMQTVNGRNYIHVPAAFDINHVLSQLDFDNIDDVEKDIDVFMCGSCVGEKTRDGEYNPIWRWYKVMEKFNHIFCNQCWRDNTFPWREKQTFQSRAKISIVWSDFIGASPECREYAKSNLPWIKFKKGKNGEIVTPQMKYRIHDAAFSKSIMLCYKSPFVGEKYPYFPTIENYWKEGEDFIYFDDSDDLEIKIRQILDNYDDIKYKKMVDSAFNKLKSYDLKAIYEKYLVPLAEKGKKHYEGKLILK